MDVMPVASDGDGENKNDDYDEADILQPLVRRRPPSGPRGIPQ